MLNLSNILKEVLKEDVSPQEVNDSINNKVQVVITYNDEKNRAPERRLIEPYAYGRSKAGNSVFRAFQYEGDTFRGIPKWKLFRLDRVTSWMPTENHFNADPKERKWSQIAYNEQGDNSMSTVLNMVKFDYDDTSNNPYDKGSDLYNIRKRTDNIKKSKNININQLNKKHQDDIKNSDTQKAKDDFEAMLKRNLQITDKEKARRGFSLSNKTQPNNNVDTQQNTNNNQNILGNNEEPQNVTQNNNEKPMTDFEKMLKRNLDITNKEKARRGFSLNKK